MKKTPLILSVLSLAGASSVLALPIMATQGKSETAPLSVSLGTGFLMDVTGLNVASLTYPEVNIKEANAMNGLVRVNLIRPNVNDISVEQVVLREDWYIRRMVYYYRNYDKGITEEVADEKFVTLGVEDASSWGVKLIDRTLTPAMATRTAGSVIKNVNLADNRSDQIYYAVELAKLNTSENGVKAWSETETQWVRGKVDYRDCVHSSIYKAGEMFCTMRENTEAGKVFYLPATNSAVLTPPENDPVQSWEEEWREIQAERAKAAYKKMDTLNYQMMNAEKFLNEAEGTLDGIDAALLEVGDDEYGSIAYDVKITRELIAKLRGKYAALNTDSNQGEITQLKTDQEKLAAELKDLTAEKQELNSKLAEAEQEVRQLRAQLTDRETEKVVEVKTGNDAGLTQSSGGEVVKEIILVSENENSEQQQGQQDDDEKEQLVANKDVVDAVRSDDSDIEVPNLGVTREERSVWWWLIPVILGLGMLGYGVKRAVMRTRRH